MYKILIVDDERSEREGITRLIRKYGYDLNILYAENGEKALEVLEKQQRQVERETLRRTLQSEQEEKTARTLLQFLEFGVALPQNEVTANDLPILLSSYSVMLARYWESYEADIRKVMGEGSMVINKGDAQFLLLIQDRDLNKKQLAELCKQLIDLSRERYQTETCTLQYAYKCREEELSAAERAVAVIPNIQTRVTMQAPAGGMQGYYREGYAFSPMFTLGMKASLKQGEEMKTWLKLEKEN